MSWLPLLLAEGEQAAGDPFAFFRGPMLPMLAIVVVMFVMMSRSSARQRREQTERLTKLKKNDKVITSAGIIGVVVTVNETEVVLRVDETSNSRIRVLKSSITQVVAEEQSAASPETKTS